MQGKGVHEKSPAILRCFFVNERTHLQNSFVGNTLISREVTKLGIPPGKSEYRSFSLSRNKKINRKLISGKSWEMRNCDVIQDNKNKTFLQVLGLCVYQDIRYWSKCFAETYRAQYENAILVYLRGTPIWRPENSVNIWNLLWLSRRLIISSEKTNIYMSTFPNALTSKRDQNHEINIYFLTNSIVALCHAPT